MVGWVRTGGRGSRRGWSGDGGGGPDRSVVVVVAGSAVVSSMRTRTRLTAFANPICSRQTSIEQDAVAALR